MVWGFEYLISGVATTFIFAFGYMKVRGYQLTSVDELFEAEKAYSELDTKIKSALGNISLIEVGSIFLTAQEYAIGGYTQEEKDMLYQKLINASLSK
jgi:hypothetical protein